MENLKVRTVTRPIHEDKELCNSFLSKVETAITLNTIPSSIPGGGSGVFASTDLVAGEEIFRVPDPPRERHRKCSNRIHLRFLLVL
jgi:hypothetical protein